MEILFPHETIRKTQDEFIKDIYSALEQKRHLLAHAPVGLGKTAAVLSTTIPFAIKNKLNIFFLTSRHTQHKIAIETLKKIKELHNPDLKITDLIGKKHMCPIPGVETLTNHQFTEYCKEVVEKGTCPLFNNTKHNSVKLTVEAKQLLSELKHKILNVEELKQHCSDFKVCPYEIALLNAKESNVIIMDYYHIFSPNISKIFLKRTEKMLEDSIIIVDEAHNLPHRILEHLSSKITSTIINRAIREAQPYPNALSYLEEIKNMLKNISTNLEEERLVKKHEFYIENVDEIVEALEPIAEDVRNNKRSSYIGSVIEFLVNWQGPDEGFTRILSKIKINDKESISLQYKCLDASIVSKDVINSAYGIICMSGTLTPLTMYSDLLGFKTPLLKAYPNPFPKKNRLNLLVPKTSTKFTKRGMGMYQDIAKEIAEIVNVIPGNIIIFFPSYKLKDSVDVFFRNLCTKTTFHEQQGISKQEKEILLENFKQEKDRGSVLLGVIGGSFSIDSNEEVFIKKNGKICIEKIGPLVDNILDENKDLNLEVPVFDSNYKIKFKKVDKVIRHITNEKLVEITLATNRKVKTTLAHSVFSLKDGKVYSKKVSELKRGEYLVIPGFIPTEKLDMKIDLLEEILKLPKEEIKNIYVTNVKYLLKRSKKLKEKDYRNYKYNNSIPILQVKNKHIWKGNIFKSNDIFLGAKFGIKFPRYLEISKKLVKLLGYYLAEGHCRSGRHSAITITFGRHEKDLIRNLKECISEIFKLKPVGKKPHDTAIQYTFGGKVLRLIFKDILKMGSNAYNKRIPGIIFQLPNDYKLEFLKGYFAGDGTASKSTEISCKTVSKKLASDLMYLFLQLEIFASINKVKSKERNINGNKIKESVAYNVYISNIDQIRKILEIIPSKHLKRVKLHIKKSLKNKRRRTLHPGVIPIKESGLLKLYKEANPAKPRSARNIFSRIKQKRIKRELCIELLNYIISNARNKYDKNLIKQINRLINSELGFAKIKEIKQTKPTGNYVYDFSIKNYENFIGGIGGICLHNSEGIDLPGDLLKSVIVVGLPLSRPNLETTELINYYDKKFSKGWDYAYIFPAMRKSIQAAGRCIRSETDKGVIVFLDERYSWNSYYKCFPLDFNIKITKLPLERIKNFFKN